MTYSFELLASTDLGDLRRDGIRALKEVVYPSDQYADHPVRRRQWLPASWAIVVTDPSGRVVSYTGIFFSDGAVDGHRVDVGGVGGIATHPDSRGLGLARTSIARAVEFLASERAAFALLVCEDPLVDYYRRIGWSLFEGTTFDTQFGEREEFTFNRVMLHDASEKAPSEGTVEVFGPLW